jgi:hypothetical protein
VNFIFAGNSISTSVCLSVCILSDVFFFSEILVPQLLFENFTSFYISVLSGSLDIPKADNIDLRL